MDGVIVLSGPPCSGKSTVGALLGAGGEMTVVHVDVVFDRLFPGSDRNARDRLRAYAEAHREAVRRAAQGETVALECTYARIAQRAGLVSALAGAQLPLRIVEFHVSPEEAARRFRRREQPSDLDDEGVRERVVRFPFTDQALRVDSGGGTPDDLARMIAQWLQGDPRPVDPAAWWRAGRSHDVSDHSAP